MSILRTLCRQIRLLRQAPVKALTYVAFRSSISGSSITIDVRSYEEYANGHIYGALHLDKIDKQSLRNFSKNTLYLLYSNGDVRAQRAAETMHKLGFKRIAFLEGGLGVWVGNLVCE